MRVYYTDRRGFLAGSELADESPLEPGVFLIPAGAIEEPPPALLAGEFAKFQDGKWHVLRQQEADPSFDLPHFLRSSLLWFAGFLPMVLLSFLVVPILCLTGWSGRSTWFGNFKYGRGDTHYKAPSNGEYWKQVRFLCIRNPVSNFGKTVLSAPDADWVWLHDTRVVGNFYWKYGWKTLSPDITGKRTFVYRPWFRKP